MKTTIGVVFGIIVVLGALICGIMAHNPNTPAGFEGYVYEEPRVWGEGGFIDDQVGPINHGATIWRHKVVNIDMRPTTYSEVFNILANDDLNVSFRVHAIITPNTGSVKDVVEKFDAERWYTRRVKEPLRTYVRSSVQKRSSSDIKTERDQLSKEITAALIEDLKDTPFHVHSVVVGNIDYPKVVVDAVEKKLAAQQLLAEKATQEAIAEADARIKIKEAEGIAAAQEIINKTLTSNYLQHEAIQAQRMMASSPNHTTIYIPVGANGVPLVKTTN